MPSIRPHGRSLLQRWRSGHYLEERSQADGPAPTSAYYSKVGNLRHEGQQSDADGGRDRSVNQLYAYSQQEVEIVGRPARKLPPVVSPVEAGIPLCRGGRLARVVNDKLAQGLKNEARDNDARPVNNIHATATRSPAALRTAFLSRCASMMTPRAGPATCRGHSEHDARQLLGQPAHRAPREDLHRIRRVRAAQRDQQKEFFTSPQMKKPLAFDARQGIVVQLRDTLEANTTYALNFGGSAVRQRGQPLYSMRYVFSTGPTIDSMIFSGYGRQLRPTQSKSFIWFFSGFGRERGRIRPMTFSTSPP